MTLGELVAKVHSYHPEANTDLMARAYAFSERMHQGQMNGYVCQGFNPLMSFPNRAKIRSTFYRINSCWDRVAACARSNAGTKAGIWCGGFGQFRKPAADFSNWKSNTLEAEPEHCF